MDLYSDLDSYVSIITKRAELPRDVPWFISFYFTKFWINERCISMEVWGNKAYHKSALTPFFLPAHVKCAHVHVNYNARCTSTVGFLFCPCTLAAARARHRRRTPRLLVPAHHCSFPWLSTGSRSLYYYYYPKEVKEGFVPALQCWELLLMFSVTILLKCS